MFFQSVDNIHICTSSTLQAELTGDSVFPIIQRLVTPCKRIKVHVDVDFKFVVILVVLKYNMIFLR